MVIPAWFAIGTLEKALSAIHVASQTLLVFSFLLGALNHLF
jgi:hypothetical protein